MELRNYWNLNLRSTSGIYRIVNIITGDCYIGSAVSIYKRFIRHKNLLIKGKHHSPILQNSFNKYGSDNFFMELILPCNRKYLEYYEQQLIDELHPKYNICKFAYSNRGIRWSEESKRLISLQRKGKPSNAKGNKHSKETRVKMSLSATGEHRGPNNSFYGKNHTQEVKEKLRSFHLGLKFSEETKAKMSEKRKIKVKINNVVYPSIGEAALALNIAYSTLCRWVKDTRKENYEYYST